MSTDLTLFLVVIALGALVLALPYCVAEYRRHSRNVADITGCEWRPTRGDS